jgi:rod shape-determining protein MreC
MKLLRSRRFQVTAVTVLLLLVALVSADRFSEVNIIRNIVSAPVTLVQKISISISEAVGNFFSGIKNYNKLLEENELLKKEITLLRERNSELVKFEGENERLREALTLKEKFSNYDIIGGNVLGSSTDNFIFDFRIDAGKNSGISVDDPVVAAGNILIGRINIVGINSSNVISLADEKSGVSAWISTHNGGHVTVKGDIRFKDSNRCLVEKIPYDVEIKAGDVVETSGLGGIYPKGITIGVIVEVFKEDNRLERYALLEPYANLNTLKEVFILKERLGGE